jgi:indoleamine 2,3-dioxygenase
VLLCDSYRRLRRPPVLSYDYDSYALYNWKRFDPAGSVALGNIDEAQDFVHHYDEHRSILGHVAIEALAAGLLGGGESSTPSGRLGRAGAS